MSAGRGLKVREGGLRAEKSEAAIGVGYNRQTIFREGHEASRERQMETVRGNLRPGLLFRPRFDRACILKDEARESRIEELAAEVARNEPVNQRREREKRDPLATLRKALEILADGAEMVQVELAAKMDRHSSRIGEAMHRSPWFICRRVLVGRNWNNAWRISGEGRKALKRRATA